MFPDYPVPVILNAGAERELILTRWGMPPPPKVGGPTITNIRNVPSELRAAGTSPKRALEARHTRE
jgi:putative SOS response-associated peptidase YedK